MSIATLVPSINLPESPEATDNSVLLVAMADECKRLILEWDQTDAGLPKPLQPKHLLWMCKKIEELAGQCPATQLHRWIGFIQCAMMANRMLNLDEVRAMFEKVKIAHGGTGEDLLDHLNTRNSFELEIGGEG